MILINPRRFSGKGVEMTHMIGGCMCGNLRYAANTEPIFSAVCHCKTCQKQTGTAFRIVVAVPRPAVSLQGLQKTYTRMGDSGQQVICYCLPPPSHCPADNCLL